jgi:hypothetical protein
MDTQTPHADSDTTTSDSRFAVLRADIKGELNGLESRLMQRLVDIEHSQKMALLQSDNRQQIAMQEMETRQKLAMHDMEKRQQVAMLEMGARLQENLAVFRTQYETTVPTLATKEDLLKHKASLTAWFLGVAVGMFVAFGGAGFSLYRLAVNG